MLPALELMIERHELSPEWMRGAAEHITEFSLGGMERIAARGRRPAVRRRR
jgi:hypothetical protein